MKIIRNNFIPVKGFKAINLFGILFVRGNAVISEKTLRHEHIHTMQMREMLYVPFYLWYGIEYVIRFSVGASRRNLVTRTTSRMTA